MTDYGVVVCPTLPVWSDGGQDHVIVKRLDLNSIRVISSVLGQSVALDFYAKTVWNSQNRNYLFVFPNPVLQFLRWMTW